MVLSQIFTISWGFTSPRTLVGRPAKLLLALVGELGDLAVPGLGQREKRWKNHHVSWENQHFQWENQQFLRKISIFNGKINDFYGKSDFQWGNQLFLWKISIFNGKINYFYGKSSFSMGKSTISMENQHFQWENQQFLWKIHHVQWRHQLFRLGHFLCRKTLNYQRVLVIGCYSYDPMHVYDIEQSINSPLISVIMSYHMMQLEISLVDVIVLITFSMKFNQSQFYQHRW